ncbi:MAG: DUF493 domain-containing protein [Wenzhouxiangellaceae bacterium]|nr:DUF493 domain-containing protein [Wenzhouxiangellaceae bacterium]
MELDDQGNLKFPCRYPVKAMTHADRAATARVLEVIARHDVGFDPASVQVRPSRNGRFQSITAEIQAESRDQLETIYADLRTLDIVVMTL